MRAWSLLLLGALVGCQHVGAEARAKAPAVVDASEYYPLRVGTTWSYEVNLLGEKRTIEVSLIRETQGGFVEDSTGAQLVADAYGIRDQKRYLLRHPIEAGTKWTNVVSVSSIEAYQIQAAHTPCEAPAGTFGDCVVVESRNRVEEGKVLVNEITFARGVGIVRLSTSLETPTRKIPQSTLLLVKMASP